MTVTGVRWAESVNRQKNHGVVTIPGKNASKQIQSPDFRQTSQGGIVLVNDNGDSRRMIESCYKRQKTMLNPIIDWTDRDVWDFIHDGNIPYCKLYDEGWHRLGCIGCPMAQQHGREKAFARWPKYKQGYLRAFGRMLELRKLRAQADPSKPVWRGRSNDYSSVTSQDVYNWWMEYDVLPGQVSFDDYEED